LAAGAVAVTATESAALSDTIGDAYLVLDVSALWQEAMARRPTIETAQIWEVFIACDIGLKIYPYSRKR
jgi:hypothetical protein